MEEKISLKQIINNRIRKLEEIIDAGINPYPYKFNQTNSIKDITKTPENFIEKEVKICGRIISLRKMGKASFFHLNLVY